MDGGTVTHWQNDPEGRVRNISLAPSPKNALSPLFEAVMNSIHAIEDRFGKDNLSKGEIDVEVIREKDVCTGFIVRDNGIGFTTANLQSFTTMDSGAKRAIGGKGVGRLLWLKVLDQVSVKSTYSNGASLESVAFNFCLANPTSGLTRSQAEGGSKIETCIVLSPYHEAYSREIPRKLYDSQPPTSAFYKLLCKYKSPESAGLGGCGRNRLAKSICDFN